MKNIYTMGIDIGSTSTKCVILKDGLNIISESIIHLGAGTKGASEAMKAAINNAGINNRDINYIVSTGYGRNSFDLANKTMSELSCHAKGGVFIFGNINTIIDIGGQDVKVLKLSEGQLLNFIMNDKCAAGTGRFLEVMARVLDVDLNEMGELDNKATERISISSTCTVFAESEVISSMAKKEPIPNIIKGIHYSVASRVSSLSKRINIVEPVAMTGGVSKNKGIVDALSKELNTEIKINEKSQIAGAVGASLYAFEEYKKIVEGDSNEHS